MIYKDIGNGSLCATVWKHVMTPNDHLSKRSVILDNKEFLSWNINKRKGKQILEKEAIAGPKGNTQLGSAD